MILVCPPYIPHQNVVENESTAQHYTVFPLALGQVLREYAVTELHLCLNAGNWNYDHWGIPDEPGVGTGAELWAWMGDGAPDRLVKRRVDPANITISITALISVGKVFEMPSAVFSVLPWDRSMNKERLHPSWPLHQKDLYQTGLYLTNCDMHLFPQNVFVLRI